MKLINTSKGAHAPPFPDEGSAVDVRGTSGGSANIVSIVPAQEPKPKRKDPRRGKMWWIKLMFKDVLMHTHSLSATAIGAYFRILFEYLNQLEPVEDNPKLLARLTGVPIKEWPSIRDELSYVMEVKDGCLVDKFADDAIAEFKKSSARNRTNRGGDRNAPNGGMEDAEE